MPEDSNDQRLTIRELFPADDLLAQWVFSLTVLSERLRVALGLAEEARQADDWRRLMFCQGDLATRLLEARRLATAAEKEPVRDFATGLMQPPGSMDLTRAYRRGDGGEDSPVEKLLLELRNSDVHFKKVGSDELAEALRRCQNYPARLEVGGDDQGPDFCFQVGRCRFRQRALQAGWGADFLEALQKGYAYAVKVAIAWLTTSTMAFAGYLHTRGIDARQLLDDPEMQLPPLPGAGSAGGTPRPRTDSE